MIWRIPNPTLRQGWVFSKRTCVFSGIQFTRHFIEFVVVETKHIVSSNKRDLEAANLRQLSGMAAGGKRRAIAFHVSVRIFYVFLVSKCRGESDLGLCTTSGLAQRMPLRGADCWLQNVSSVCFFRCCTETRADAHRRHKLCSTAFWALTEVRLTCCRSSSRAVNYWRANSPTTPPPLNNTSSVLRWNLLHGARCMRNFSTATA